jgi:hypothetical protein
MDLKLGDIIAIVVAIAIPVIGFAVLIVPGAMGAVVAFVMQEDRMPYVFYGGALIVFAVLAFRIYRRIRPRAKPADPDRQSPSPTGMPKP